MEEVKIYSRTWETDGTLRVIRIEGFLDTTTSQHLAKRLDMLLEEEVYKIVIDLEAVDYISSPGWGILVGDIRRIRENSGDLKLARMKPEVYEIYTLLGLDSFIESYDSVEEACSKFAELPLVIEQPIETKATEEEEVRTPVSVERVEPKRQAAPIQAEKEPPEKEVPKAVPPVEKKLTLTEMVQEIAEEHPSYNTWKVKKELDTERYDFTKVSWFKVYRETGAFPSVTRSTGVNSLAEILREDAEFPSGKEKLIRHQGWKLIDLTNSEREKATYLLQKLPEKTYNSVDEVVQSLEADHVWRR